MSVTIEVNGVREMQAALNKLARSMNKEKQREIAVAGAEVATPIMANEVPVRKNGGPRPYYSKGKKIATFLPGNLKGSTTEIGKRRIKVRRAGIAIVGPIRSQKRNPTPSGEYGRKKFDGYYAHMVYGSAKAYQRKVVAEGRKQAEGPALRSMIRKAGQLIQGQIKVLGL